MIQRLTKVLESTGTFSRLTHTQAGIVFVPVDVAGTVTAVTVEVATNLSGSGSALFNIRLNGVPQWSGGTRLAIASGARLGTKTGLAIVVAANDDIQLDLEQMPGVANIGLPIVVTVSVEDGVTVGGNSWDATIVKPSTQSVISSTTYVDDTALQFNMAANGLYAFEARIWMTCAAGTVSGKCRYNITQTAVDIRVTTEFENVFHGSGSGGAPNAAIYETNQPGADNVISGAGFFSFVEMKGYIKAHATLISVFKFQFAQNSSDANNLNCERGSVLSYKKA